MNRGRIFRRRFDTRRDRRGKSASALETQVRDRAADIAERTREGVVRGLDTLYSFEHALAAHIRKNPILYLVAAAACIGLLSADLILRKRKEAH